jgi:hypothetical protein
MCRAILIPALAVVLLAQPALAQPVRQKEELVDQVKNSIDRGVNYLRRQQSVRGDWERGGVMAIGHIITGGQTCLAMLALLNCGVKPDDQVIQLGLKVVRSLPQKGTYVVALQTMVLAEIGDPRDKLQIQSNVDWLLGPLVQLGNNFIGWSYTPEFAGHTGDFSNTQYALLGLHAGKQAGAKIPDQAWALIKELYKTAQNDNGSWSYSPGGRDKMPRLTMTTAGLSSLHIAGMELKSGRQGLDKTTGVAKRCGEYDEDPNIRKALEWLKVPGNFSFDNGNVYYSIYGVERAGRLSGHRFMADRDWYREGCKFLVDKQQPGGEWNGGGQDGGTVGSTAFALLFLSKGRTPTLISKLAWGQDWNRKHNDARYIVEYCSRDLFKKTPLAWQVYDCRHADQNRVSQEAADLLQSPIVYFNGHDSPLQGVTGVQKEILKKFVQEGGFIIGEACCGSPQFAQGFRDLMKELFDKDMVPVGPDHAIYRANAVINAADAARFPLERLDLGCKTVVILATKPLAGYWEENLHEQKPEGVLAFRLIGNIVAYATNMELPKPKLTTVDIGQEPVDIRVTRNFLEVGQLRHEGDWEPAPAAMRNLMAHLRTTYRLDVSLKKADVRINSPEIFQHRFLYMHGRGRFTLDKNGLKNLSAHLKTGGLLLADACCGSKEFDSAFREMAAKLFPEAKLELIPEDDELYSARLNGSKIDRVKCRRPREGQTQLELQETKPALEGIRWAGRWVVIYSKYDLGCALEKHPSSDCVGHDHESALKLAGAAVLYYLRN